MIDYKKTKKQRVELYHDNFQNYKSYHIPKAQLIIADIPFNIGKNAYGSNPKWYKGGDNSNGESEFAKSSFFNTDGNFRIAEYMHFCAKMLVKEPKEPGKAPAMLIFCGFEQQMGLVELAQKYGLSRYINLIFRKNYSAQVLKANMRIVGNAEYGLLFYRDKLPKFNNNGKMVFNIMDYPREDKEVEKIHPTQKPIELLKRLIELFTDPGEVVIDPVAGSGSTLIAALETNRDAYGFEIATKFYKLAKKELDRRILIRDEIKQFGYAKTELQKKQPILF